MTRAFICYANEDQTFARLAEMNLTQAGYDVWRDEGNVRIGQEWRKAVDDGIAGSDVLLVVITPAACESRYVTYEWAFALGRGIKVVPLMVEHAELHPRLAVLQYLDFTNRKVMPWERLFLEIDDAPAAPQARAETDRVGDMTTAQLQEIIAGAVSLATASARTGSRTAGHDENAGDSWKVAKSVVEVVQRTRQADANPSITRKNVLWVDDLPDNNVYERNAFESMGFRFTLATSTNEALRLLERDRFVAVISDMGRREGPREGYVLLDRLRAIGILTPFFIYSGSNLPEHKREAAARGAQGATSNPQELFEMVTRIVT